MKTKFRQIFAAVLVLISSAALFGCGDKSAVQPVAVDPLGPRYEATLAEGIDFKKPGYPTFLAEVSGMSGNENWGRQSDANNGAVVRFRFKQPLPRKFTLGITANVFGPNLGEAVKVRVGGVEKTFVHKDANRADTYSLVFESTNGADTIEIVSPKPTSPAELKMSGDTRKLGVGLISLKIRE